MTQFSRETTINSIKPSNVTHRLTKSNEVQNKRPETKGKLQLTITCWVPMENAATCEENFVKRKTTPVNNQLLSNFVQAASSSLSPLKAENRVNFSENKKKDFVCPLSIIYSEKITQNKIVLRKYYEDSTTVISLVKKVVHQISLWSHKL